jgi:MATE family multidrug resistance protein
MAYMIVVAAIFITLPEPLLYLFRNEHRAAGEYARIMDLGAVLMRFLAVFCFFDALNLVFSGAIKGAGDTRFIMWTIAALSLGVMVLPVYIAVEVIGAGIYTVWTLATIYISSLGTAFMLRYRNGSWKKMRVIENRPEIVKAGREGMPSEANLPSIPKKLQ